MDYCFQYSGAVALDITHTRSQSTSSNADLWLEAQTQQYALYTPRPWHQHRHGPRPMDGTSHVVINMSKSIWFICILWGHAKHLYPTSPHWKHLPHVGVMTMLYPDRNFQHLHCWVQAWLAGWLTAVFLSTRSCKKTKQKNNGSSNNPMPGIAFSEPAFALPNLQSSGSKSLLGMKDGTPDTMIDIDGQGYRCHCSDNSDTCTNRPLLVIGPPHFRSQF